MADKKQITQSSAPKAEVMALANEVRAKTNTLGDAQREAALQRGMQLIYGGPQKLAAKTGRP